MSTPFKMKGFSGFGNSPMKQSKPQNVGKKKKSNKAKTQLVEREEQIEKEKDPDRKRMLENAQEIDNNTFNIERLEDQGYSKEEIRSQATSQYEATLELDKENAEKKADKLKKVNAYLKDHPRASLGGTVKRYE